ncbi:uncharacterized protein DUF4062 [Zymomonas mobilis]|uniref:DUF4062 domain-containing protein n=1 Tax=Zymomonas mobilis TaxID=542 RepID=UPI00026D8373|nr:DUF4062 domain-containing protein [Zymomonas mobilis]AFN57072.1 hypothetical protein ZZ6_1188 [Zymomonas mobilis subsp. mobilis ATCC 29191]TQK77489.1 uncharacterized protein DUF4062 [Zymomonas mobilis]TQL15856.1 uncharacterized protein DUF4062 [Zymomonas mobilis]GEB88358.1 hypothetical protein ZMO01_16980 [Zymomonas mobilis subsp. mobilis]
MIEGIRLFRIFIASPSGLEGERQIIRNIIKDRSSILLKEKIMLESVGWEDVPPNNGRPQEIINEYIDNCDYAIFLWHDRWGSSTGKYSSGTEEEFLKIKELHNNGKIKRFSIIFKKIDDDLKNSNEDVIKILDFKKELMKEQLYLLQNFSTKEDLEYLIKGILENWFYINKEIEEKFLQYKIDDQEFLRELAEEIDHNAGNIDPKFFFCIEEIKAIYKEDNPDYNAAIVFAKTAKRLAAEEDLEYVYSLNLLASAQFDVKDFDGAIQTCDEISQMFGNSKEIKKQIYHLRATLKKLMILSMQGRIDEYLELLSKTLDDFPNNLLDSSEELIKIKTDFFNRKGRILAHLENIPDAKKEFENAIDCISKLPKDRDDNLSQYNRFSSHLDLGLALSDLGYYNEADSIYEEMLQDYTKENTTEIGNGLMSQARPSILYNKALNLFRNKNDTSLDIINNIIENYSNSDDIFTYLKVVSAYSLKGSFLTEKEKFLEVIENSKAFFKMHENKKDNTRNATLDLDVIEKDIVNLYAMEADALYNLDRKKESKEKKLLILEKFKKSDIKSTKLIIANLYSALIYSSLYEEKDIDGALNFISEFEQSFCRIKNIVETETVFNIFQYKVNCFFQKGDREEAMKIYKYGPLNYLNN